MVSVSPTTRATRGTSAGSVCVHVMRSTRVPSPAPHQTSQTAVRRTSGPTGPVPQSVARCRRGPRERSPRRRRAPCASRRPGGRHRPTTARVMISCSRMLDKGHPPQGDVLTSTYAGPPRSAPGGPGGQAPGRPARDGAAGRPSRPLRQVPTYTAARAPPPGGGGPKAHLPPEPLRVGTGLPHVARGRGQLPDPDRPAGDGGDQPDRLPDGDRAAAAHVDGHPHHGFSAARWVAVTASAT